MLHVYPRLAMAIAISMFEGEQAVSAAKVPVYYGAIEV